MGWHCCPALELPMWVMEADRKEGEMSEPKCRKCGKHQLHADHIVQFSSMKTTLCQFEPKPSPSEPSSKCKCGLPPDKCGCTFSEPAIGPDKLKQVGHIPVGMAENKYPIDVYTKDLFHDVQQAIAEHGKLKAENERLTAKVAELEYN